MEISGVSCQVSGVKLQGPSPPHRRRVKIKGFKSVRGIRLKAEC